MSGDLKERIEEMLAGLGGDADAVADSLRTKGIRGNRDDGCDCPIARVILAEFPESAAGEWADSDGGWFVTHGYIRTPDGEFDPPAPVAAFIELFDDGDYHPGEGHFWRPYEDLEDNPPWRAER